MRRIRYQVACSLDGYIAGPQGDTSWIPDEPAIEFGALFAEFETLLMGRKTFAGLPLADPEYGQLYASKELVVVSTTLTAADHRNVTIINELSHHSIEQLRQRPGKDIWLFGGGELFRHLLALDVVDTIELAIAPVLLGNGIPFLPAPGPSRQLTLTEQRRYEQSGIVWLSYRIEPAAPQESRFLGC
ncbi:dihydrofolate reductase family protein [uncultured Chloroflexus sp.]|uniref:dihydrofolate reductase family protein n=1 Tax=uncultured Chloroflexus sp. TaxID=214040 RepID=UPI00261DADFA|nr:dihydrofolate reductase family protein [uncultured Chloroflexus sp.]